MSENRFSVIIPLYNKEQYIRETIDSVLKQSHELFEVIVVNDGSTDGSLNAIEEITDNRVKIINKHNNGVSHTRNIGIQHAKYEWIAFLDADDIWDKNYLSIVNEMIKTYSKADAICINYGTTKTARKKTYQTKGYISDYFEANLKEYLANSSSTVVKKQRLLTIGGFNEQLRNGEDIETWYRLAKSGCIFAYYPDALSFYRKDDCVEINRLRSNNFLHSDWAYYIDFSTCKSESEKAYLYKVLGVSIAVSLRNKLFRNIHFLIKRHGINEMFFALITIAKNKLNLWLDKR